MLFPSKTLALLGSATIALATSSSAPQITLPSGDKLTGSVCSDTGTVRYRGIPYAQPPTGSLRFKPPKSINRSISNGTGTFDASQPAAPCMQYSPDFSVTFPTPSENCLTVDVYVPAKLQENDKLPVKFWAYGGSNQGGATSYGLYDGCHLATDVIAVEFNYRLGPLGFLGLTDAGVPGNMAIQDALAALHWVQDNIAAFGGDKSRVMMFGQSAGADNTFTITSLPQSNGLIHSAVTESGGGQFMLSPEIANKVGAEFAKSLNCSTSDLACLQKASLDDIATAYTGVAAIVDSDVPGQMVSALYQVNVPNAWNMASAIKDGTFIKDEPLQVGPQVPIIAGAAANDGALFSIPLLEGSGTNVSMQNYTDFLDSWGKDLSAEIGKLYPLSLFNTTGSTTDAIVGAITHMVTMAGFVCPSHMILRAAQSVGTPAYGYRFNHTLSCPWLISDDGPFPTAAEAPFFAATHTSEIPFVFGSLDYMPFSNGTCNSTAAEWALSAVLMEAWSAHAYNATPVTSSLDWPKFDVNVNKGVYVVDTADVDELDFTECDFWDVAFTKLSGVSLDYISNNGSCAGPHCDNSSSSSTSTPSSTAPSPTITHSRAKPGPLPALGGLVIGLMVTYFLG